MKKSYLLFMLLTVFSCTKKKAEDPTIMISPVPPAKGLELAVLDSTFPNAKGEYITIKAESFVNGNYSDDLVSFTAPSNVNISDEESYATSTGVFPKAPGLRFKFTSTQTVSITLTTRGQSETVKRAASTDSILSISMLAFPKVFPPAFRENYELVISSLPEAPVAFSFKFTFAVIKSDSVPVNIETLTADPKSLLKLGKQVDYTLNFITPSSVCKECIIEVESFSAKANIKYFSESAFTPEELSSSNPKPSRFKALVVKNKNYDLTTQVVSNNTSKVSLKVSTQARHTSVNPWCAPKLGLTSLCPVVRLAQPIKSYFTYLNAIPFDVAEGSAGSIEGVYSYRITGEAKVVAYRDGVLMERKTLYLDSGLVSPLDDLTLPGWVLDDFKNATQSGASEYYNDIIFSELP